MHEDDPECKKFILTPGEWWTEEEDQSKPKTKTKKSTGITPLTTQAKLIKQARAHGHFDDNKQQMALLFLNYYPKTVGRYQTEYPKPTLQDASPSPLSNTLSNRVAKTQRTDEEDDDRQEEKESVSGISQARASPSPSLSLVIQFVLNKISF